MDFITILEQIKEAILQVSVEKYGKLSKESKKDINDFLMASEVKLKNWTLLLENKQISVNDYEWLVKSQIDLLEMKGLQIAGISKISLGHFKNKIIKTIVNTVVGIVL